MSNPSAQPPTLTPTFGRNHRLPTAWFLSVIYSEIEHHGLSVGRHVVVSRSEDGLYRVLFRGVALLWTEGVARRHLRRVRDRRGAFVRVAQQQIQTDRWEEARAERRRAVV